MYESPGIKAQLISAIALLSLTMTVLGWLGIDRLDQTVQGIHSIYVDRVVPLEQLKMVSDIFRPRSSESLGASILFK